MTVLTVGDAGTFAFSQSGIMAAIAFSSNGDTIRLIQAGTISCTLQVYAGAPVTAFTFAGKILTMDSDPALYTDNDPTTLPKLLFGGGSACKCLDDLGAGSQINGLQFEGFQLSGSGNAGGVINYRGRTGGGADNLSFIDTFECLQQSVSGVFTRIRGFNTLALVRGGDFITLSRWWVRLRSAATRVVDLSGIATSSSVSLGSFYFPGTGASDIAFNLGGTSGVVDVSGIRASNTGTGLFLQNGTRSYCTQTGFNTFGGTDGGNNATRDPLFSDAVNGEFNWAVGSLEAISGDAIGGVTEDIVGIPLPNEGGWPRGAYASNFATTIDSIEATGALAASIIGLGVAEEVVSDATWEDAGNYTVTSDGSGVAVTVATATQIDALNIELITSEMTTGQPYTVAWAGLTNIADGDLAVTGAGLAPTLTSVAATAAKTLRLVWAEAMANNAALTTAASYVVTPTVAVSTVTRINATTVDLTLAERVPGATVEVTVTGPQDIALNPAAGAEASAAYGYLTMVPPGTVNAARTGIAVAFNVPPTTGADGVDDWTVEVDGVQGAVVSVLAVAVADEDVTLTVHPALTVGVPYTVTPVNAANAAGPLG